MAEASEFGHPFFASNLICYMDRLNIAVAAPVIMEDLGWDAVALTDRWDLIFYLAAGVLSFGVIAWDLFATGEQVLE